MLIAEKRNALLDWSVRLALIAGCFAAAVYAFTLFRASLAFRQLTASGVETAARLVPFDATYLVALAQLQPAHRIALLHRALALNGFDSKSLIELGLDAEFQQHDSAKAEKYFKQAAAVDKMFLPRLTLANFYFRQEQIPEFLEWVHRALDISPYGYNPRPLYQECWSSGADPASIAAAIPDYDRRLFEYASFLLSINRPDLTVPVFERGIAAVPLRRSMPGDERWYRDSVGIGIDHLLDADLPDEAVQLWTALHRAGWIGLLAPPASSPLNNTDFSQPAFQHGFDWAIPAVSGVRANQFPDIREIRLTLSGTQPEFCVLLRQYVVLQPLHKYTLSWDSDAGSIPTGDGFTWRLYSIERGDPPVPLDTRSPDITLGNGNGKWRFQASDEGRVYLIALEYTRPIGRTRAEGSLVLRHARLSAAQ
jgi:tetratricopeptide (TPR) repeat protein